MPRPTMSQLIARVRTMIGDPISVTQQFDDQFIQDTLDESREDIRYETLQIAPSIVNLPSTNNQPVVIFADYYSAFQWWEQDVVIQGINTSTNAAWAVLNPAGSDFIVGRFQFELTPFVNGVAPSQYPPVFCTGKIFDVYYAAADLLDIWAAALTGKYDMTVNGQSLRRSQEPNAKLLLAQKYRMKAKPKTIKMVRRDVNIQTNASRRYRLLDAEDPIKGG